MGISCDGIHSTCPMDRWRFTVLTFYRILKELKSNVFSVQKTDFSECFLCQSNVKKI